MSFNLASSHQIIRKAGAGANSVAIASGNLLADYCDQAEAKFCAVTKFDWITNWSSLGTNFKAIATQTVASLAAMEVINYDMTGYSRADAQTMLDVLDNIISTNLKKLEDANVKSAVGAF